MRRARAKQRTAYHHGNLRRDLVTAALELINKSGSPSLTLRAVGRRLGVSQAAPYRHFASKQALLAAVANDGFATLLVQLQSAMAAAGDDPLGRYQAMAVGYLHFAVTHPGHFRVMYGPQVEFGGLAVAERRGAFRLLTDAIAACQAAGLAAPGSPRLIAVQTWAYAHGLATLHLHGLLHRSIDKSAMAELARDVTVFLRAPRQPPAAATVPVEATRRTSTTQGRR